MADFTLIDYLQTPFFRIFHCGRFFFIIIAISIFSGNSDFYQFLQPPHLVVFLRMLLFIKLLRTLKMLKIGTIIFTTIKILRKNAKIRFSEKFPDQRAIICTEYLLCSFFLFTNLIMSILYKIG